jgi:catalase
VNGPVEDPTKKWHQQSVSGQTGRFKYTHPNCDFEQPRVLFRKVMNDFDREHLIMNICSSLGGARRDLQEKMVKLFYKIDPEYGQRVAKGLGLPAELAKL